MKSPLALFAASVLLLVGCGTTTTTVTPGLWQSMEGPRAQDVTALLVSGESTPMLLAGTEKGEVYRAENPGMAWKLASPVRKGARIHRFIRDPENPAGVYAATDAGLYVSTSQGASWKEVSPGTGMRSLAIDPWNTAVMYAGTEGNGILKSTDAGTNWAPANGGIPGLDSVHVHEILVDLSRPDRIFAAVSSLGVVLSTDAGRSWSRLTEEFKSTGSAVTHLVQNPQSPETIVYGTDAGAIRKSMDGGATWSPTRNGFTEGSVLSMSTVHGRPDVLLVGTESGVLVSRDFGSSWADVTGSLPRLPVRATPSGDGQTIYVFGEGIGLQQTVDSGATWTHVDENLAGATVRFLTTDEKGERLYAALEHAVVAYDFPSESWQSASSGLPGGKISSLVVDSDSPLHVYAATSLGGFESSNGGQTWRIATRNMRITPRVLEPHPRIRTRMLASGSLGLDVSTDKGTTWRQTKPFSGRYHISSFTYAPRNTGVIYGASPQAVVMSKDGGFLWESSRYGLNGEDILAITLDAQDPSLVYAWTSDGGGYRSLDGGLEWNKYSPPWTQNDSALIAFDRYQPFSVVALVNGRDIYYSPSGGGTWFSLLSAKLNAPALSLWWNAPGAVLYVGTEGEGVHRIALGQKMKEVVGE